MEYRIKLTVVVGAQSHAEALQRLQSVIEPKGVSRATQGMFIDTIDKVEAKGNA